MIMDFFNSHPPLPDVNEKLSIAINDKYGQQLKSCGIGYLNKVDGIIKDGYIKIYKEFSLKPKNPMGTYNYMKPVYLNPVHLILINSGRFDVRVGIEPGDSFDLTLKRLSFFVERAIECRREELSAIKSWE